MADLLGLGVELPSVDFSGLLSNTWIYVFIVAVIGFLLLGVIATILFMSTYNKKIIFFENISGKGYSPSLKTRARTISIGRGGEEVLKTLKGGKIFSAYGRKMGKNTYWFAKGQDGYYYNFILGDLDTKLAILDIEPVDRDVRMFHVGIGKLTSSNYGEQKGFIEKFGTPMLFIIMAVIILVGFYVIAGKINEGLKAMNNPEVAESNKETASILLQLTSRLDNIQRGTGYSGLIQSNNTS